jgi:hypothetical protein
MLSALRQVNALGILKSKQSQKLTFSAFKKVNAFNGLVF